MAAANTELSTLLPYLSWGGGGLKRFHKKFTHSFFYKFVKSTYNFIMFLRSDPDETPVDSIYTIMEKINSRKRKRQEAAQEVTLKKLATFLQTDDCDRQLSVRHGQGTSQSLKGQIVGVPSPAAEKTPSTNQSTEAVVLSQVCFQCDRVVATVAAYPCGHVLVCKTCLETKRAFRHCVLCGKKAKDYVVLQL
jgi:hypothetical protein